MRLWPYQIIDVLPRRQLISQLRENTLLSVVLDRDGKTNHIFVNNIMDYDIYEFRVYCQLIVEEMYRRGYKVADKTLVKLNIDKFDTGDESYKSMEIFKGWHDERNLRQCYYNLQEKYDYGQFSEGEWVAFESKIKELLP